MNKSTGIVCALLLCILIGTGVYYYRSVAQQPRLSAPAASHTPPRLQDLQTGDVLLRTGNDITSNMLRQLNLKDRRFSHCGMVVVEADTVWVYHSIGSERYPDQPIQKVSVSDFGSSKDNIAIGYAQMELSAAERERIGLLTDSLYRQHIPFDLQFDLNTDDRLYCSEFVAKVLLQSVPGIPLAPTDTLGKRYWSIDNITHNPRMRKLAYYPLK